MTVRPGCGDLGTTGPADDGMVTAELALTLPTIVVVLAAAVTVLLAVATQLRCADAAATAARLAARGEPPSTARAAARAIAGAAAVVQVSAEGGDVVVEVQAPAVLPQLRSWLHLPAVSAQFREPAEPGSVR